MNKPTQPTPTPDPDTKRASPNPSDETLAIRALRDIRKLDASLAKLEREVKDKKDERTALLEGLPEEAKRILGVLQGK